MQRNKTKGSALARVQAVSPGFRAALVQPSAALRPFRFAPRVGDPPRLDSCYPGLACDAAGALAQLSPKSIFRKERNQPHMNINRVTLAGFTGKLPETRSLAAGKHLTKLSVATTKRFKDAKQNWQEKTQWHDCVAYGPTADYAAKIATGAHVFLEGHLVYREYERT